MIAAVISLTLLGVLLGVLLGIAARFLAVQGNPLEAELMELLPGSQCGQCGFPGCAQAAAALAAGEAPVTLCPPGGRALATALAERLGVGLEAGGGAALQPRLAFIDEASCIGCLRCQQACSTDGIVGARNQIHTVLADACHGCGKCVEVCPTEGIRLVPVPTTLTTWHWPKPDRRARLYGAAAKALAAKGTA